MNYRQLQCAILLAKVGNFSQAAEKFGISQSSFSKQILSLEQKLGIRLFDRDSTPIILTPAGEHFIREAQELVAREERLILTLERFQSGDEGRLVIGLSQFRGIYMMPSIIKRVKEQYPGIQVCLHETSTNLLRQEAAEGKFDFAVVNLPVDDSVLDVIPLEPDKLVLAIPNEFLGRLKKVPHDVLEEIDLKDCRDIPFVVVCQGQEMRQCFERLCAKAEIQPNVCLEVHYVTTAWSMATAGIGATLVPLQYIAHNPANNVSLFTIRDNNFVRQPAIIKRRGNPLPAYAELAIDLLCGKE